MVGPFWCLEMGSGLFQLMVVAQFKWCVGGAVVVGRVMVAGCVPTFEL